MPIIRDRNGKVVVSSDRITPMSDVQRQMEAERKFKELQRQRALHASAATQRDPLLRERFQRKMQQAQAAPAYGQEYGDDARAAADFAGKQLYGPTWNQPQSMPTQQDIVDGKMAREREDYTSGQYQKRMEAESDMADEVGGPGGGLDFLDAPTPMANAGQPDIAQERPAGPQVDPMQPGRNVGPLTDFENEVGPERPRGMANIPNKRMMDEAKQLRDWRQQEFQRKQESLNQARQFKLARQIAARNQQAAIAQQQANQPGLDPVTMGQMELARRYANSRNPRERMEGIRLAGRIRPPNNSSVQAAGIRAGAQRDVAGINAGARGASDATRERIAQAKITSAEKIAANALQNAKDLQGMKRDLMEAYQAHINNRQDKKFKEDYKSALAAALARVTIAKNTSRQTQAGSVKGWLSNSDPESRKELDQFEQDIKEALGAME